MIGFIKINLKFNSYFSFEDKYFIQYLMPLEKKIIEELIKNSIPDAKVIIEDLRGDGDHYSATVISKTFDGKSKIEQHKMVYNSLEGKMGRELHALMLKTKME